MEMVQLYSDKNLMKAIIISLFTSSFSLILSYFGDYQGNIINVIMAYAVGVLFWLGLIIGYVLLFILSKHRKAKTKAKKCKPGIIVFFSNKPAKIADLTMVGSLILTLAFTFIPFLSFGIETVFLAILVFSIHMHCLFNGVNFKYINSINKRESKI